MQITNFGGNVCFTPKSHYSPTSESEVLAILEKHRGQTIRCIGRLHSWSRLIECDPVFLDLSNLQQVEPNSSGDAKFVDVGAGCQIKRLLAELNTRKQWTLPSVGFITEQSVAGSISTGTHGSGRHSLSHYVISVRVARYDANGTPVIEEITQEDELRAARCSLGCLGVILSVRMQCRDAYRVEEHFQEYRQLDEVELAEERFPLQQFYLVPWRWTIFVQHRRETEAKQSMLMHTYLWYRFLVIDVLMHLLILFIVRWIRSGRLIKVVCRWVLAAFVIRGWRVVAPSRSQLVMEHELFRHVELEIFIQKSQLSSALEFVKHVLVAASERSSEISPKFRTQLEDKDSMEQLERLRGRYCHSYPICVRKILPDDTLISMATNATSRNPLLQGSHETLPADEPWYSITLTNFQAPQSREAFDLVAEMLTNCMSKLFGARPHWGKLNSLSAEELRSLYPAFDTFREICDKSDPHGAFRNAWTKRLLDSVNDTIPPDLDHVVLKRIGPICDAFEAEIRRGAEPVIEDFLATGTESDRSELLFELLKLDREYRVASGKQLPFANYFARFPNDENCLRSVLVEEETIAANSVVPSTTKNFSRDLPIRLGQYLLLEVLGQGGMGVVYRAVQYNGETPIREVAFKLVRTDQWFGVENTQSSVLSARFREEMRLAAQLKHDNIVRVYDVGQIDGLDYFSMELIDGTDLASVVKLQRLSYFKIAETLVSVAQAISFAHSKGIVHRDLKPSNILLDSHLKPYIADFGLAKSTSGNSDLTQTGQVLGTAGYMAPEQAAGDYKNVGVFADIYGLGGLLYFCLTGQAPFVSENVMDALVQVLESEPVPPRTLKPQIPRSLELICMRCLEKKPEDRYANAKEVAEDLERFLKGRPTHAKPPTLIDRLRRIGRRSPVISSHLGALGFAFLIGQLQFAMSASRGDLNYQNYHFLVSFITLAWIAISVLCGFFGRSKRFEAMVATFWLCADSLFLTVLISMMFDKIHPPGAILIGYPMLVVGGGMFFRARMVVLVTIVTMLSYLVLLVLEDYMLNNLFQHAIFLVLLACIGICSLHQVRRFRMLSNYIESRREHSL